MYKRQIVNRVVMFAFSVLLGFGQGFQPVCGFNYGAKRYDRVRQSYWFCVKVGALVPVSYTHLDVYKRQGVCSGLYFIFLIAKAIRTTAKKSILMIEGSRRIEAKKLYMKNTPNTFAKDIQSN